MINFTSIQRQVQSFLTIQALRAGLKNTGLVRCLQVQLFVKEVTLYYTNLCSIHNSSSRILLRSSTWFEDIWPLDILFSSNHHIHKSLCGLYFWSSDPLIDRF